MPSVALGPISPELVLVCPELVAEARAALPDRDLDPFARPTSVADEPPDTADASRLRVWSALAYTVARLTTLAVWSALWVGVVALLVTVPLLV